MLRVYHYRRKLPHHQCDFESYFITFCTYQRYRLPPLARTIVLESCLHSNGTRYDLHAVVVMPDHVHLLLTPMSDANGPLSLPEILQNIKSFTAHRINQQLHRKGKVWQDESFDRALRYEESPNFRIEYMMGNPLRAGLVKSPMEYRWLWRAGDDVCDGTGEDARASRQFHK